MTVEIYIYKRMRSQTGYNFWRVVLKTSTIFEGGISKVVQLSVDGIVTEYNFKRRVAIVVQFLKGSITKGVQF